MSDHPLAQAPNSKAPYLAISYYDFQEWIQIIDQDRLSQWEMLRFKSMTERYFYGRALLQVPIMGLSYFAAHIVMGPPLRRRDAGFRDAFIFSTFFYFLIHHWVDQVQVPDRFLDELYTQSEPNGEYLKKVTRNYYPSLWENFKSQLDRKGFS